MNLPPLAIVAGKELADALRDRRSILTMAATALLGPLLISFVLNQRAVQKGAIERIDIPVAGAQQGPELVDWLRRQDGISIVVSPLDAEAAVRGRGEDLALVIDEDFSADLSRSRPARVQVFTDSTRAANVPKAQRVAALVDRFGAEIAAQRLIVRGISPEVAAPIRLEQVDVANSQQRGATLLSVVLSFLAMAIITSAMQIATDSTAGERERGSLEALLLNGTPRWQLAAGKWLAASAMGLAGMILTLATLSWVLSRLSLEQLGVRIHLGPHELILLSLAMAPLAFLLPAIQTCLACFARSYKEAQSYAVVLIIPVVAAGALLTLYPIADAPWAHAVPLLAQYGAGIAILAGKPVSAAALAGAGLEAVGIAIVLVGVVARMLAAERIVFGR
jgi:sodium transport system permease protein